jgi:hypothetical protein
MSDVILGDVVEQVEAWAVELAGWRDRVAGVFSQGHCEVVKVLVRRAIA